MSIHSVPRPAQSVPVLEAYFQIDHAPRAAVPLRPLTVLEQMYAYWGSDRA